MTEDKLKLQLKSRTGCDEFLRVGQFVPSSGVNGPGRRAVIWVQGCTLDCPGCFNPSFQPLRGGWNISCSDLFRRLVSLQDEIEGITLSGGEPLQQPEPLLALLGRIRQESTLSVLLFSGFTRQEIERQRPAKECLAYVDVLIAGRYESSQHLARGLRGSANQEIYFLSDRYTISDLQGVASTELFITPAGELMISGIDPIGW